VTDDRLTERDDQPRRLDVRTRPKCPQCGGWDMGNIGLIHHKADCPRNPCLFCGLEIMPGEKRTMYGGGLPSRQPCHYDCLVDFEHDRDKESRHG
jgi:hypothetical protein